MTLKPWAIVERLDCTLVIPTAEVSEHLANSMTCKCKPDVMIYNPILNLLMPIPLIIHRSFKTGETIGDSIHELFGEVV